MLYFAMFALGAAVGSFATWKIIKDKYERIAQEEIDSVKQVFSKRAEKLNNEFDEAQQKPKKDDSNQAIANDKYKNILNKHNYTKYSESETKEAHSMDEFEPYVIPPEEFGELDDYETISLTYYSDGMLTDDQDNIIEDVVGAVGWDYEDHFGEYEDDSVFIRNDARKCDYEILRDERCYRDLDLD